MPFNIRLFDGSLMPFEDGTPREEVLKAIDEQEASLRANPYHSHNVDWNSGAEGSTRAFVGHHDSPEKKLEIIQKLHPGAVQYGEDNYLYPTGDGKSKLYNPSGFDTGDLFENGKTITQIGAGIAAGPATGMVGGAAIGAGAGQVYDYALDALLNATLAADGKEGVGYKPASTALKEGLTETALGSAFGYGTQKVVKALNPISQRVWDSWKKLGIMPKTVGSASEASWLHRIENGLANMLGSGGTMTNAAVKGNNALGGVVDDLAERISPRGPRGEALGAKAQEYMDKSLQAFQRENRNKMNSFAPQMYGESANLGQTSQWILDEYNRIAYNKNGTFSKESADAFLRKVEGYIGEALKDESSGGLNFNALWESKKKLGNILSKIDKGGADTIPYDKGLAKRLNGLLAEDMDNAVSAVDQRRIGSGGSLLDEWNNYKDWYSNQKSLRKEFSRLLKGGESDVKGARVLSSKKQLGAQDLDNIRSVLGPQAHDDVAANLVAELGGGAENFTPNKFLTDMYSKSRGFSPEALSALITNTRDPLGTAQTLGALRGVSQNLTNAGKLYNTSQTAGTMETQNQIKGILNAALRTGVSGGVGYGSGWATDTSPGAGAAIGLAGPLAISKILTSPRLIKALGEGWVNKLGNGTGKMAGLLRVLPEITYDANNNNGY